MDLGSTIGELQEAPLAVVVRGGCLPDFFFGEGGGWKREVGGGVVFLSLPNSFSYRGPYFKSTGLVFVHVFLLRENIF